MAKVVLTFEDRPGADPGMSELIMRVNSTPAMSPGVRATEAQLAAVVAINAVHKMVQDDLQGTCKKVKQNGCNVDIDETGDELIKVDRFKVTDLN